MEEKHVKKDTTKIETKETNKEKSSKNIVSKIVNIVLWIVLICWMIVVFYDYIKVKNEESPKFCLGNKTTTYDDGDVTTCSGLGYKVITYNRTSFKAIEFGPFWIKDRTAEDKK